VAVAFELDDAAVQPLPAGHAVATQAKRHLELAHGLRAAGQGVQQGVDLVVEWWLWVNYPGRRQCLRRRDRGEDLGGDDRAVAG
jgi:hypothetical protein